MGTETQRVPVGIVTSLNGGRDLYNYTRLIGLVPSNGPVRRVVHASARGEIPPEETANAANREILRAMDRAYKLQTRKESPEDFFINKLNDANRQVNELLDKFCPAEADTYKLRYDGPIPQSPVELLTMLHSPGKPNDPKKFALQRLIGIALLTAEMEAASQGAKNEIDNIQAVIINNLAFSGLEDKIVFSLHDNKTNEVHWATGSGKEKVQEARKKVSKSHLKKHKFQTWKIEDVGPVSIKKRIKPNPAIKTIREALGRAKEGGDDSLHPLTDVKDAVGLEFVVHNAFSSRDEKVTQTVNKVKDVLKAGFGLTEDNFEEKKRNEASYQSPKFDCQRLMVTFPGLNVKIELMFHGMGDYLNNKYEIGDIDRKTGKPFGRAHELMEVDRDLAVLQALFPHKVYGGLPWDTIKENAYERAKERLQNDRAPADKLTIQSLLHADILQF